MFGSCLTVSLDSESVWYDGFVSTLRQNIVVLFSLVEEAADFLYIFLSSSNLSLALRCVSVAERSVSAELGLDIGGRSGAEVSG